MTYKDWYKYWVVLWGSTFDLRRYLSKFFQILKF